MAVSMNNSMGSSTTALGESLMGETAVNEMLKGQDDHKFIPVIPWYILHEDNTFADTFEMIVDVMVFPIGVLNMMFIAFGFHGPGMPLLWQIC